MLVLSKLYQEVTTVPLRTIEAVRESVHSIVRALVFQQFITSSVKHKLFRDNVTFEGSVQTNYPRYLVTLKCGPMSRSNLCRSLTHVEQQELCRFFANALNLNLTRARRTSHERTVTFSQFHISDLDLGTTSLRLLLIAHDNMKEYLPLVLVD